MEQSHTAGADCSGANAKVAVVSARFNGDIVESMRTTAHKILLENGVVETAITHFHVPGAFELPLTCKQLALSKKFNGIIALGCVIRGDTPHFDYVNQGCTFGIQQASLETGIPIAFGVLTTDTVEQALSRSSSSNINENKGHDVALCVLEMINTLKIINP